MLLEEWIKKRRVLSREEALTDLALRYFTSDGPATPADFSGWTKLVAADVKSALGSARSRLSEIKVDGVSYFMAVDAADNLERVRREVETSGLALPPFDEYVLGYKSRGDIIPGTHAQKVVPGNNGVFMATILGDGQINGTWRRTAKKSFIAVDVTPFVKVRKADEPAFSKRYERSFAAYGAFMNTEVRVSTVG